MGSNYENICVRVDSERSKGSGVIIRTETKYYVITAFHCIGNLKKMELDKNIYIWGNKEKKKVELEFIRDGIKYTSHKCKDLAVIELTGKVIVEGNRKNIEEIFTNKMILVDTNENEDVEALLIGFPSSKRLPENISLERDEIKLKNYRFDNEIGVFNRTNSQLEGYHLIGDKLRAYSGAGIFLGTKNAILLVGVFVEYDSDYSLGKAISPLELLEFFNYFNLEKPITTNSFIRKKIENELDNILEEEKENRSLCLEFKKKILLEINKIEKIINELSKSEFNYPLDEYIKFFIEKLFLLSYFEKKYELDEDLLSIKINNIFAKIFKGQSKKYSEIKAEFFHFISDSEIKINKGDNIYIPDIHEVDGGDFNCGKNCRYVKNMRDSVSNFLLKTKILPNFFEKDKKEEEFDFMSKQKNEKKIVIKCGGCISIDKKEILGKIGDKLWS